MEEDETLQSKTRNADKRWNCLSVPAKSTKYAKEKHEANITIGRTSIYFQNQYKEMTSENEGIHGELTKSQELNAKSSLQRHDFNSNSTCTRFPEEHQQSFNWIDHPTKTKQDKQVSPTWNPFERHDEYIQTRHYPQGTTTIQDQESHANTKFHDQCQDETPEILKNHDEYTETFKQQDQHDTSTIKQQDQHDTSTFKQQDQHDTSTIKQQDQHDTSTFKQQDQHDTSTFKQQDQHDTSTFKQQDQHDTSTFKQQDQHDTSTFTQQDQHDTSTLHICNSNERATDDCQNWVTEEEAHVEESHFSNKENFDDRFDDQSLHADETTQRKYSHEETLLKNQKRCLKTFEEPDQQFDSVNSSRENSSFEQQIPTEMDHKFVTRHEQPNHDSLECKNPQPGALSKHVPQEETKVDTDEMPMFYNVRADITPYSECSLKEITNIKNATERNEQKIRKRLPKKRTSTKTGNEFMYDTFKVQHFYRNPGILDVKVSPSTKMRNHENYPVTFYDKESTPDTKEKTERSENRKEVMADDNVRDTVQKALLKEGRKSETRGNDTENKVRPLNSYRGKCDSSSNSTTEEICDDNSYSDFLYFNNTEEEVTPTCEIQQGILPDDKPKYKHNNSIGVSTATLGNHGTLLPNIKSEKKKRAPPPPIKIVDTQKSNQREIKAQWYARFSVNLNSEDNVNITCILYVLEKIVIVDTLNKVLKLYDHNGRYLSKSALTDLITGITHVHGGTFATCGGSKKVRLYTVHGQNMIKEDKEYQLEHRPHRIHFNGRYYCILRNQRDNHTISILEEQGRPYDTIEINEACGITFVFGDCIYMDRENNNIYVSCSNENGILSVTLKGEVLWFTRLTGTPRSIIDVQGTLCVADSENVCIKQVSKCGKVVRKLLDKEDLGNKLHSRRPWCLCFGENEKLYVSETAGNREISVFLILKHGQLFACCRNDENIQITRTLSSLV